MKASNFSIPEPEAHRIQQGLDYGRRRSHHVTVSSTVPYSVPSRIRNGVHDVNGDFATSTSDGSDSMPIQRFKAIDDLDRHNSRRSKHEKGPKAVISNRQEYLDMQLEISRLRSELNDLLQERSDLLATRLDNEMAIAALQNKRLEEQRRSSSKLHALEETLSSTVEVAKARRDQLETMVSRQSQYVHLFYYIHQ